MSTMKGNNIIIAPKKQQRPCPKPKKVPKQNEQVKRYYYNYNYYDPQPTPLRLIPYLPWRKAWTEPNPWNNKEDDAVVEEDEKPPRIDGKTKSLIKRLNKSPNSVASKERTQYRNKSRQMAQAQHISYVVVA